jgi:uncharacterized membrane protein
MSYDDNLERLEHQVGRVLRTGVFVSSTALAVGLALLGAGQDRVARLAMTGGLLVLTAIPATRIVASFVDALRRRDPLLAASTAVVLSVLGLLLLVLRFWT